MRLIILLFIGTLMVPTAMAHGAPEAREIDVRSLSDGTASGDYGGPEGLLSDGAPDLLTLDVREAIDAQGQASIGFRFIHQLGDAAAGTLGIALTFDAAGQSYQYGLETKDGTTYTSTSFSRVEGPFDVGDGTPKAVEGWVRHADLGVETGDDLTNIRVTSLLDGTRADHMPGTYELQGQMVPAVPPEENIPGAYKLVGPASLIQVTSSVNTIDAAGQATANLTVSNSLSTMEQFVALTTTAPAGVTAVLESDGLALAPGESRTIRLTITGNAAGEIAINARSDLGDLRTLVLPILGAISTGDDANILSGDIANGGSFQHTFTTVGVFDYHCHPHPWMTAQVKIEAAQDGATPQTHTIRIVEPDASDGDTWRFEPSNLIIKRGDTVAWVNEGSQIHVIMGGVAGEGHHAPDAGDGAPGHHEQETQADDEGVPGVAPMAVLAALGIALVVRRRQS